MLDSESFDMHFIIDQEAERLLLPRSELLAQEAGCPCGVADTTIEIKHAGSFQQPITCCEGGGILWSLVKGFQK